MGAWLTAYADGGQLIEAIPVPIIYLKEVINICSLKGSSMPV